ncbi:MAG: hypothetical protein GX922_09250 [Firmicutes bacterium]|nr:hypothetical protein [Bacillota bacterium]
MLKTKDLFLAGFIAGWAGNIAKELLSWSFYLLGWVKYTCTHIAAGVYYNLESIDAPLALLIGAFTDWTLAGTFGVVLALLLRYFGSDYAIFKGTALGALWYTLAFGAGMTLKITRVSLTSPLPDSLLLLSHLIIGAVSGWVLEKYYQEAIRRY